MQKLRQALFHDACSQEQVCLKMQPLASWQSSEELKLAVTDNMLPCYKRQGSADVDNESDVFQGTQWLTTVTFCLDG